MSDGPTWRMYPNPPSAPRRFGRGLGWALVTVSGVGTVLLLAGLFWRGVRAVWGW